MMMGDDNDELDDDDDLDDDAYDDEGMIMNLSV